jgi:hypothetical protein
VSVLVAWLILIGFGRSQRSRDWLDSLGRGMGFLWIFLGLLGGPFRRRPALSGPVPSSPTSCFVSRDVKAERRLFSTRDLLILSIATAIGYYFLRSMRHVPVLILQLRGWGAAQRMTWSQLLDAGISAVLFTTPIALAATGAVFAMSWQQPRPPLRQLVSRAGFQAVAVVTLSFLLNLVILATWILWTSPVENAALETWENGIYTLFLVHSPGAGAALMITWLFMALVGRRRAIPTCLDRAGRWLGWYWIATIPCLAWLIYNQWI